MEISFKNFRNTIEAERAAKYRGKASIKIDSLTFSAYHEDSNTHGLENIYRAECGSRHEDPNNHLYAIIEEKHLDGALASAGISVSRLLKPPYVELEFPKDVTIECLEGQSRIEAAKNALQGFEKRWIVNILINDASPSLRTYINDGLHFKKQPSDGEYFCKIRGYQGISGKKMPIFEEMWLAHLSAVSRNRRDRFDQICNSEKYLKSFDNLLMIPALFSAFRLTTIHTVIAMKCPEPVIRYLEDIFVTFNFICHGKRASSREEVERLGESAIYRLYNVDKTTIEKIEGTAPGINLKDRNYLHGLVSTAQILNHLSSDEREAAFERMCTETEQRPIPSLKTFFKDIKILEEAANSLKILIGYVPETSIDNEFYRRLFTHKNQQMNQCMIQVASAKFGYISGDFSVQSRLGLIQLWLAAFRLCRKPKKRKKKCERIEWNVQDRNSKDVMIQLATLAMRLGAESGQIEHILSNQRSDRLEQTQSEMSENDAELYLPQVYGSVSDVVKCETTFRRRSAFLTFFGTQIDVDLDKITIDDKHECMPVMDQPMEDLAEITPRTDLDKVYMSLRQKEDQIMGLKTEIDKILEEKKDEAIESQKNLTRELAKQKKAFQIFYTEQWNQKYQAMQESIKVKYDSNWQSQVNKLEASLAKAKKDLKSVANDRSHRITPEVKSRMEAQESQMKSLSTANETLSAKISDLETKLKLSEDAASAVKLGHDSLKSSNEELEAKCAALTHQLEGHKTEVEAKQSDIDSLLATNETLKADCAELEAKVKLQRNEADVTNAVKAELDNLKSSNEKLKSECAALEAKKPDLGSLLTINESLETKLAALENKLNLRQGEADEYQRNIQGLERRIRRLVDERDKATKRLVDRTNEFNEQEKHRLERLRKSLQQQVGETGAGNRRTQFLSDNNPPGTTTKKRRLNTDI